MQLNQEKVACDKMTCSSHQGSYMCLQQCCSQQHQSCVSEVVLGEWVRFYTALQKEGGNL